MITLPQFGPTCWFNALMMGLFYSQGMRNLMCTVMDKWKSRKHIQKDIYFTLSELIKKKYNGEMIPLYPEEFLKTLHKLDPKEFYYNPDIHEGSSHYAYLTSMLKLTRLFDDTVFFDIEFQNNTFIAFDGMQIGHEYDVLYEDDTKRFKYITNNVDINYNKNKNNNKNPNLIIFSMYRDMHLKENIPIKYLTSRTNGMITKDMSMVYNGREYIIDSLYLANFNINECNMGHAIAGVTCKSKRYMYNGWIKTTNDNGMGTLRNNISADPCALMEYDWLDDNNTYCINTARCKLDKSKINDTTTQLCFNFKKGLRTYFAVRRDIYDMKVNKASLPKFEKIIKKESTKTKAKESTKANNSTNAVKTVKTVKAVKAKKETVCKDNKVKHPDTGRCVKDIWRTDNCPKGYVKSKYFDICIKECPKESEEGLNLNQCIKKCKPGQVRNVSTNRCIKAPWYLQ
jgi:hypothetical protein